MEIEPPPRKMQKIAKRWNADRVIHHVKQQNIKKSGVYKKVSPPKIKKA